MQVDRETSLVTRSHGLHVRAVREEMRQADFVASTTTIDAYDEIVEQDWNLDRFHANPVVLYAHQSRDLPIGVATMCAVLDGMLQCTIRFLTADKNPVAEQVWKMVRDGELKAVSVGFLPHSYSWQKRNDREVLVLSKNELHEISVVPIPANPEALSKMKAKAIAEAKQNATNHAAPAVNEEIMTEKELQEQNAKLTAEKALAEKQRDDAQKDAATLKASVAALEGHNKTLVSERDAAIARAEKAENDFVDAEVSALVGVKITPAEKDDFVLLRKSNPALFTKFVEQRSVMKNLQPAIPPAQVKASPALSPTDDEPDLGAG